MNEVIKTARSININNISVHLNDNDRNIEVVAEYDTDEYTSVSFPREDWSAVKSAIEDLLENGGTDEWVKKSEASANNSITDFQKALEVAELKIKTDMIASMAALAIKHQDTTKEQEAELSAIVAEATKEYQDKINELPANLRYAVWNVGRNR